jgi:YggT family protein
MYGLPFSVFFYGWLVNILIAVFIFRIWCQACNVNIYNPIASVILNATRLPVRFLGNKVINGVNLSAMAAIAVLLAFKYIGIYTLLDIPFDEMFHPVYVVFKPLVFIIRYTGAIFLLVLVIDALLSWFGANTVSQFTRPLTAPISEVLRKFIPPIGMIDISFIILLILLQLADYLACQMLFKISPDMAGFLWTLII